MNLSSLLAGITTLISIAPQAIAVIKATVKDVEAEFASLPGTQKLAAVEARVNSFLDSASDDISAVANIKAVLTPTINSIVAGYNAVNLFRHAPAAGGHTGA